jgi:hypothetical protein
VTLLIGGFLASAASPTHQFSEMQVVRLPIEKGTKSDLLFTVANTAVIFGSTSGFSALVSLGHSAVRHFGTIGDSSDAVGVFFGDDHGKIRILGHSNFELTVYALVPPVECNGYWITTGRMGTFSIGGKTANATDSASVCWWHVYPSPRTYAIVRRNFLPADQLLAFVSAHHRRNLVERVRFEEEVVLVYYRPDRSANGRSIEIGFSVDGNESFPFTEAYVERDGSAALLHASAESVRRPEKLKARRTMVVHDGVEMDRSCFSRVHLVVVLSVGLLAAAGVATLVVANCIRTKKSSVRAAQDDVALLSARESFVTSLEIQGSLVAGRSLSSSGCE